MDVRVAAFSTTGREQIPHLVVLTTSSVLSKYSVESRVHSTENSVYNVSTKTSLY
jgi:hypothetical protein